MKAFASLAFLLPVVLITPCDAQLDVTFVGNNGVLLNAGGDSVLIDSLYSHTDPFWTKLSSEDRLRLFAAEAPFDNVRWSLTTHNHPDHHNTQAVNVFSGASTETEFLLPPQARGALSGNAQVLDVNVPFQNGSAIYTSPGISIEVFHMEHFDQFGNNFSGVQDYTYLVTMGGVKLLHLGDIDYIPENFAAFDFPSRGIDAVVLPTFNTLLTEENRGVILDYVAPKQIIATHLRAGQLVAEEANVRAIYPEATIFTRPLLDRITLTAVPEPAAAFLTLMAGVVAFRSRRDS